jgi:hypothetical protein
VLWRLIKLSSNAFDLRKEGKGFIRCCNYFGTNMLCMIDSYRWLCCTASKQAVVKPRSEIQNTKNPRRHVHTIISSLTSSKVLFSSGFSFNSCHHKSLLELPTPEDDPSEPYLSSLSSWLPLSEHPTSILIPSFLNPFIHFWVHERTSYQHVHSPFIAKPLYQHTLTSCNDKSYRAFAELRKSSMKV